MGFGTRFRAKLWAFVITFVVDVLSHVAAISLVEWSRSGPGQREARKVIGVVALAIATHWLIVSFVLVSITLMWISTKASREVAAAGALLVKQNAAPVAQPVDKLKRAVDDEKPQGAPIDEYLKCLQLLASGEVNYSAKEVAGHLSAPAQKGAYYIDRLLERGEAEYYVNPYGQQSSSRVVISAKGRETLVRRGLL